MRMTGTGVRRVCLSEYLSCDTYLYDGNTGASSQFILFAVAVRTQPGAFPPGSILNGQFANARPIISAVNPKYHSAKYEQRSDFWRPVAIRSGYRAAAKHCRSAFATPLFAETTARVRPSLSARSRITVSTTPYRLTTFIVRGVRIA